MVLNGIKRRRCRNVIFSETRTADGIHDRFPVYLEVPHPVCNGRKLFNMEIWILNITVLI